MKDLSIGSQTLIIERLLSIESSELGLLKLFTKAHLSLVEFAHCTLSHYTGDSWKLTFLMSYFLVSKAI